MIRAFAKLEEVALANGQSPTPPGQWEFELRDGTPVVLVRTLDEVGQVKREPTAQVWSLEEIANMIASFPQLVAAKTLFPEAEVIQMRTSEKARQPLDDELSDIPF